MEQTNNTQTVNQETRAMQAPCWIYWNTHRQDQFSHDLNTAVDKIDLWNSANFNPLDKWEIDNRYQRYAYNPATKELTVLYNK